MTDLQLQYYNIKRRFPQYFLFFQLGEFYELWNEDAIDAVKILGITLTQRSGNPMCGIPINNVDFYIKKLIKESDRPVAMCTQKSQENKSKNIVERDVTKVYTKGTYVDILCKNNNFILSCSYSSESNLYTLLYTDVGTEETYKEFVAPGLLSSYVYRIDPAEIIVNSSVDLQLLEEWLSKIKYSEEKDACSILSVYLKSLGYYMNLVATNEHHYTIKMSAMTMHNLEIFKDLYNNNKISLLNTLDYTSSPMGHRALRKMLTLPTNHLTTIENHYNSIDFFIKEIKQNRKITFNVGDLEKLIHRLNNGRAIYDFMIEIKECFNVLNNIKNMPYYLEEKYNKISELTIHEHILLILTPGDNMFMTHGQMQSLQQTYDTLWEKINNLPKTMGINGKIKCNSLIGYYFECKNSHNNLILKQQSGGFYRYTSQELLSLEGELQSIKEQINDLESNITKEILILIEKNKKKLLDFIKFIGLIDCYNSCAIGALKNNYYKPEIIQEKTIEMIDSRHCVMEQNTHEFIKNNILLDKDCRLLLISGPNMGGKSTILRQVALNLFMAHCGLFVPCKLKFSPLSGIFVRIGANDRIHKGESTFKVEMLECGEILNLANENSLIIMDEIGRGTSTKDGMSISFGILEYIHDHIRCFSLISTHYNELTQLSQNLSLMVNKKMSIENQRCTYKLEDGVADNSFGINVAKQSNLPTQIINTAEKYFSNININIEIKNI